MARSKKKSSEAKDVAPKKKSHKESRKSALQRVPPLPLLAMLVFLSGCSALVFQVTWMRELRLIFGATTGAVSAVLAIFMAGLGVGSAVLGRRTELAAKPLRMYGQLEVGISIAVAVSPILLAAAGHFYLALGGQDALGITGATAVRLCLAAFVMGVPAFLMGGTLPAISRSATRPHDSHRGALAILYGVNTLGAVFGSVVATFYALEQLGSFSTLMLGCGLSLLAGLVAIRVARGLDPVPVESSAAPSDAEEVQSSATERLTAGQGDSEQGGGGMRGLIYATAAAAGFTFFALEIVWYRMLAPILGGTTFTFGTILGVALLGIGLGGLLYNLIFSRWVTPTLGALALTCGLEAFFTMVPYAAGDRLAVHAAWLTQNAESFAALTGGWLQVTSAVVLGVAIVSGLQFPLLIALLGEGRRGVGRQVGVAYAWNTLGAISGSLVAGFGALPLLTAPGMWVAIGGGLALLSVLLVACDRRGGARTKLTVGLLAAATVVLACFTGPTAGWRHSGIGAGRAKFPSFEPNAVEFLLVENRRGLAWEADGLEASIGVRDFDGYEFVVNGKVDGNSISDASTQVGVALLGAVLHEDPKTAMVIGLGTGESVGWLAEMRAVERVDAVELEPAIDKMVELCAPVNFDALNHPEVRRIYNDGRETVFTTDDKYDVIISEPSNPYRAGVATLYTEEFYAAASRRLNRGGVFVQFLQAYEIDNATVATVLATVRSAFKHVEVWQTLPVDMQLVCSNEPILYSEQELRTRLEDPVVRTALEKVWRTPGVEGFLSHFVANAEWVDHVSGMPGVEINTDDRTILEYRFAKTVGQPSGFAVEGARALLSNEGWHRPSLQGDPVDWRRVELVRQANNLIHKGVLSNALLTRPEDQQLLAALEYYRLGDFKQSLAAWPEAHRQPDSAVLRLVLGHCMAENAQQGCLELVAPLAGLHPSDVHAVRTIYYWYSGSPDESEASLAAMMSSLREEPWGLATLMPLALERAVDLAQRGPEACQRVYGLLEEPFVTHRLEYMRRITRVLVAMQGDDPTRVVDAFAPLEPHAPWQLHLLEARANAYRETDSPLAERAEADVARFTAQSAK
ncbi:spermidine synthase [Pseudobythopirellula maris]|uniref:Spermidine synthase n=1 Tax=Pseudobythopirellula maris TaxID=2527991 RepID=A0A5C5ZRR8_9BACT|nr:fused MFS/spermidine synthase [Pseudobythopirellula maris]TWT90209.1 spermidine synthase [Pseudobythopirellula maris]